MRDLVLFTSNIGLCHWHLSDGHQAPGGAGACGHSLLCDAARGDGDNLTPYQVIYLTSVES